MDMTWTDVRIGPGTCTSQHTSRKSVSKDIPTKCSLRSPRVRDAPARRLTYASRSAKGVSVSDNGIYDSYSSRDETNCCCSLATANNRTQKSDVKVLVSCQKDESQTVKRWSQTRWWSSADLRSASYEAKMEKQAQCDFRHRQRRHQTPTQPSPLYHLEGCCS
ncbi:hypothetical protein HYDPIDRAFT_108294, partial [Hydnomerulius pinastri MD-312]